MTIASVYGKAALDDLERKLPLHPHGSSIADSVRMPLSPRVYWHTYNSTKGSPRDDAMSHFLCLFKCGKRFHYNRFDP
ncbi:hypothetical protein PsorP6_011342 [Peronosclerospora sorghi]|uniref:Uncharacterized protein n=1 Tax=Peronosclerospora sorghi TaxID=230839 RepID=A0ACC0WHV2_9STRA|nr:hypothetical protein PsorP6_011342 [Peronosclerospora sorghi]